MTITPRVPVLPVGLLWLPLAFDLLNLPSLYLSSGLTLTPLYCSLAVLNLFASCFQLPYRAPALAYLPDLLPALIA